MSLVHRRDTKPEQFVRALLRVLGYRYRLHGSDLPGKPDIVVRRSKRAIFVNGCFWHQHKCSHYRMPRTRLDFWRPKLEANVERDTRSRSQLRRAGWRVLVLWECQLHMRAAHSLTNKIVRFMEE
jgi:DNA mismatch endonuclease (patch repair protein)